MVIKNASAIATEIRKLKKIGLTDKEIATELGLTFNRVHYLRAKYGIGGRYELYSTAMRLRPKTHSAKSPEPSSD